MCILLNYQLSDMYYILHQVLNIQEIYISFSIYNEHIRLSFQYLFDLVCTSAKEQLYTILREI